MKTRTVAENLEQRVTRVPGGCWEVSGSGNKPGWHVRWKCGALGAVLAHRATYEHYVGPIPSGLCVLHRCDNPKCVNPDHLFLGTRADNVADMWAKGRQGPRHGHTKGKGVPSPSRTLSDRQVQEAAEAYFAGATQRQLAERFGVSDVAISYLLTGKTYQHIARRLKCGGRSEKNAARIR